MNKYLLASTTVGILFLSGCSWFGSASKEEPKLRIVSLLEKKYFDDAHIKAAPGVEIVNIEGDELATKSKDWDSKVPVVTYCSNYMCLASHEAAKKLKELGFKDVGVYTGGIAEWYQLAQQDPSYAFEGPAQEAYLKVVLAKPKSAPEDLKIVTAQELQKSIKEATLQDMEKSK